jgi:FkbM family methyltransferase
VWRLLRLMPPPFLTFVRRNTSPRLRFAIRQRFGADYHAIPDKVVAAPDGRRFHVGPDPIYWAIYQGLEYEPEATGLLRRLVQPGDVVADVGANIGWYSTLCASLVGATGHVFAFEPVPRTRAKLAEHLALNGVQDRVTIVGKAVGATGARSGTIHVFDDQSAALSSMSSLGASRFTTVSVDVISLDEFMATQNGRRLALLKCDVEGAELDVINGAQGLLSGSEAPFILIELNRDTLQSFGHTKADIMQTLQRFGYTQFFDVASASTLRRLRHIKELSSMDLMLCGKSPYLDGRILEGRVTVT